MKKIIMMLWAMRIALFVQAQDLETGLLFNEEQYNALPQMSVPASDMGFESEDLASSFSLKTYCPRPGNQGAVGSCMAWALGYGAQTIDWAKRNGAIRTAQSISRPKQNSCKSTHKPTQNPTLRWVFQVMRGIQLASLEMNGKVHQKIINLKDEQVKILNLFGGAIEGFYTI